MLIVLFKNCSIQRNPRAKYMEPCHCQTCGLLLADMSQLRLRMYCKSYKHTHHQMSSKLSFKFHPPSPQHPAELYMGFRFRPAEPLWVLYFKRMWRRPCLFFLGYNITVQAGYLKTNKYQKLLKELFEKMLAIVWCLIQTASCEAARPVTIVGLLIISGCSFSQPLTHEEGGKWEEASIQRKAKHLWWISSETEKRQRCTRWPVDTIWINPQDSLLNLSQ